MKILAPISSPDETEDLLKAGADELYCGLLTEEWRRAYANIGSPNRREYARANLTNYTQLQEIIGCASKYNVKVFLTLNERYSEGQYPVVMEQAKRATALGVDGFILADLGLLRLLKEKGLNVSVSMSTGSAVFNSESAKFFKSLGTHSVTLPRHLSLGEIKEIVTKNPDMRFEIFILNGACRYADGFCTFIHGVEEFNNPKTSEMIYRSSACYLNYDVAFENNFLKQETNFDIAEKIRSSFKLYHGVKNCALCFLPEFKEWGIYGLKIVGREDSKSSKVKDTQFVKALLTYLKKRRCDKKEFRRYTKELFWSTYHFKCNKSCYYEY